MIWVLLHYGRLYSQSNVPQFQTVFRHLTLCKAHRLELKHGKQLLPGVDDLALHISQVTNHRHMGNDQLYQLTLLNQVLLLYCLIPIFYMQTKGKERKSK